MIVPPTQSCIRVLVCLRATFLPVMRTPSGACVAVGSSHVFLLRWVGVNRLVPPQGSPDLPPISYKAYLPRFSSAYRLDLKGLPPRGLSFWLSFPPTQSCFKVLVCLRATFLPFMITPSGACAAMGPSHVFLLRWIRGEQVGASSG